MILDSTFLSALLKPKEVEQAKEFLKRHRSTQVCTTIVNVAEIGLLLPNPIDLKRFLGRFQILPLHWGAAVRAAEIDRILRAKGERMGEADTLIAGIAMYNSQPVASNDEAFDRVVGLRRIAH